jgi:hypothetical protein
MHMSMDDLWRLHAREGYAAVAATMGSVSATDHFFVALLAFGEQDLGGALSQSRVAAALEPTSILFAEATRYLERVVAGGKHKVYASGDAFGAFIRGGGNTRLYRALSAALRAAYRQHAAARLLDVGVGDGLALLPAIDDHIASVTLVEPSLPMLTTTADALARRGVAHQPHHRTLQAFARDWSGVGWDIAQATFSLQSIPPDERASLLAWMRGAARRVLIAEFDLPRFEAMGAPDQVRYVKSRYERGLAEYADDGGLVARGFLMPVMFGYFDRTSARTNYEQPIGAWAEDLRRAGFTHVEAWPLDDYWWAPAHLLDAW